ncbi:CDP-alcohol phosphatidyltransferase family protein [Candidatus Saccharibacteria bacterium]|nr:CDP-alcohol phosphatidyltransferase family protein [Candidatus Saccharibacteria bacterium]NIV03220.1 CDP-alcohol phosphatidyltransferase family protein [Calditrichia bacterium]NIV72202.1 CDP-alcohol phosphatidyltransferase family protein [Calditrichia bacterium]NIV99115.1 CDP-alcohol phosphatidyltransferase family protein [Candidatus Saccharibacteria bacterium]NIW78124.1 CDP-alcohol phosphatidyltransferase family protein [Calditrichia bacterium]
MEKKGITILPDPVKNWFLKFIDPPIEYIARHNIHPNFFTILGFIISCLGAYFYAVQQLRWGGVLILLGGICDILDGKVARRSGLSSKFGAVFDSTLDRYAEFAMYFGVGFYFLKVDMFLTTIAAFLALGGSMLVSYVRARAEGLGYECKVGIMQRAERIVYIGFSSLIHEYALVVVICVIAVLANFTVFQRMYHVWRTEKSEVNNEHLDQTLGI